METSAEHMFLKETQTSAFKRIKEVSPQLVVIFVSVLVSVECAGRAYKCMRVKAKTVVHFCCHRLYMQDNHKQKTDSDFTDAVGYTINPRFSVTDPPC